MRSARERGAGRRVHQRRRGARTPSQGPHPARRALALDGAEIVACMAARVPFLDREVIALALRLPAAWKVSSDDVPEKRLLRQAFEGWLPHDLLWREKAQFGDGSGAAGVLTEAIESTISEAEFAADAALVDPPLRTREELAYYRIWREHLAGVRPEQNLGRFATA